MNYEKDIRIEETALDIEWLEQAGLMMKYSQHAARMAREEELAKEALELCKAELDKAIRTDPTKYGLEKVTEGALSATILQQEEYKEAYARLVDARYEVNIARGAVTAFSQRKDALENLVRLHGQQYFAGPRIPRDIVQERENRQARVNAAVGKVMRTKIKRGE